MNAENFSEVIKNPSKLYQIPYQELKSLALQYPYCRNLHHLLLTKLLQTNSPEQQRAFDAILEKTATLSIDRQFLYQQMRALQDKAEQSESFELGEEFLELRDLAAIPFDHDPIPVEVPREEDQEAQNGRQKSSRDSLEDLLPPEKTAPSTKEEEEEEEDLLLNFEEAFDEPLSPERAPSPALDLSESPVEEKASDTESPVTEARSRAFQPDEQLLADCATLLSILEHYTAPPSAQEKPEPAPSKTPGSLIEDAATMVWVIDQLSFAAPVEATSRQSRQTTTAPARPAPKPKSSFKSWVKQFQPSHMQPHVDDLMEAGKESKRKKKKKKKDKITTFAEQSLLENEEVATETLAELLVRQERYDKAIRVYERLRLIFPEKNSFFAEKIEQLKKQL